MSAKTQIFLAQSALQDLEDLQTYYFEQGVPAVGEHLVAEIMEKIEILADHPEIGRMVPEFGVKNLRELIHRPFRIVYRCDPQKVRIIRVWRSERILKLP